MRWGLASALTDQRRHVTVEFAESLQVTSAVMLNAAQGHPDLEGLQLEAGRREVLSTDKLEGMRRVRQ